MLAHLAMKKGFYYFSFLVVALGYREHVSCMIVSHVQFFALQKRLRPSVNLFLCFALLPELGAWLYVGL